MIYPFSCNLLNLLPSIHHQYGHVICLLVTLLTWTHLLNFFYDNDSPCLVVIFKSWRIRLTTQIERAKTPKQTQCSNNDFPTRIIFQSSIKMLLPISWFISFLKQLPVEKYLDFWTYHFVYRFPLCMILG
jgi:hypothetical protein